ncbi:hypothetical protein E2562_026915 [Oryza meyeriana var. granulata]|uniref:Uncharacterized protein n=1 Tax=Oryza meyeriana var. granulata TaxID=110450 RepID=A0A6G1CT51_9ORYZ|nr:hypothetical protein E2562_026915 [Oryza meyeriana var. granulata]
MLAPVHRRSSALPSAAASGSRADTRSQRRRSAAVIGILRRPKVSILLGAAPSPNFSATASSASLVVPKPPPLFLSSSFGASFLPQPRNRRLGLSSTWVIIAIFTAASACSSGCPVRRPSTAPVAPLP